MIDAAVPVEIYPIHNSLGDLQLWSLPYYEHTYTKHTPDAHYSAAY